MKTRIVEKGAVPPAYSPAGILERTGGMMLFGALLLLLTACGSRRGHYDASGVFESTEIIVSSEAAGKLMRFDVTEGQRLEAGQEVGFVDTLQLYLRKMQLLSSAKSVRSRSVDINTQIAATNEQITTAQRERQRNVNLLAANASTQKAIDDIDAQIAVLQKQLAAQLSTLQRGNTSVTEEGSALDIQVEQIEDQLRRSRITSPISGTVLAKYAEAGEIVSQGRPLFKIADTDHMFLRAYITSDQLSQMRLGQTVTVYADFGEKGSRAYDGTVTWISDKAEFTPKTIQTRDERANLVYAVKIAVENDGYLKIGMYGEMKLKNE